MTYSLHDRMKPFARDLVRSLNSGDNQASEIIIAYESLRNEPIRSPKYAACGRLFEEWLADRRSKAAR